MPGQHLSADYLILKRRQQEEHKMFYERVAKSNFLAGANAEWEIKTAGNIAAMKTQKRFDAIRRADSAALNARRQRLADMLGREQQAQEQGLALMEESPEQTKLRMETRAKMLGAKREAERQEFVRAAYERQWRLACDPLREKESQAILKATNAARAYQIGEKMQQYESEEQENRVFDSMWEQNRLDKLGREEREEGARLMMDHEQKAVLDRQVRRGGAGGGAGVGERGGGGGGGAGAGGAGGGARGSERSRLSPPSGARVELPSPPRPDRPSGTATRATARGRLVTCPSPLRR
jgi:hypothetical protein